MDDDWGIFTMLHTAIWINKNILGASIHNTYVKIRANLYEGLEIPNYEFKTFSQLDHDIQWETKEK